MEKEEMVYEETFKYYAFSLRLPLNRHQFSQTFCDSLHGRLISIQLNASDKVLEFIKLLGRCAFEEYWRMAGSTDYWGDGEKDEKKLLPHRVVVERWQQNNKDVLRDGELRLLAFRGALES
jgi:hypothetical protein